jgi:tetratricopeptide (TPR) repeat protein
MTLQFAILPPAHTPQGIDHGARHRRPEGDPARPGSGAPVSDGATPQTPSRVFISYAQFEPVHSERVRALAHALADDGLDVELDQFHVHESIDWPRWCEERLRPENTNFVLMVCSAEYRRRIEGRVAFDKGRGVFWEGNLIYGYLFRDKANERFIPLLLDGEPDSSLPPVVANWTYFRLQAFGLDGADAQYEVLYRLLTGQPATPKPTPGSVRRLPPRTVPAPDKPRPTAKPVNLPYPSLGTLFKGREGLLADIRAGFEGEPGQAQVIVARHAIHGLGGIGKTRAAVEYAWRHVADYRALLFLTAQSPQDLHTKLAALCDLLGLAEGVTEGDARVQAALGWLAEPANQPWLLIADNVDTADAADAVDETLANLTGGHLLITGRLSEWPGAVRALPVNVLDPDSARDFLLERTDGKRRTIADDAEQAAALAKELGCLALALEQAAAFIRRRALSFSQYLRLWQAADRKVLQWHDPRTMQYERPLATTWQTSIEALPPAARALLDLLAWLAPERLPRFLFDHAAAPEGTEDLFADSEEPRETLGRLCGEPDADPPEALAALRDLSLLQLAEDAEFPSEGQIHRVVALITRERQTGEARTAALKAALSLMDAATVGDCYDVRSWPILEPLQPHITVLVYHAESDGIAEPTARLLNDLGGLLAEKARYAEAEPLMRRALAIDEASYGSEHPKVAIGLNNLAMLLRDTNRLGEAEPLMRRALAIDEASYGSEHPNVAIRLNNLAMLLRDTNRLGEAEPLMRRALAIDEASYGSEHPNVAIGLDNLATLLRDTNRLGEAEPLMRKALAIGEVTYGPKHPEVALILNNLSSVLHSDPNRLGEAELLMRRALTINEENYGPKHPSVARNFSNLAQFLQATNRLGEAEPFMRRALAIDEASFGSEHPRVAIRLNNLAQLLQATNRLGEAEPLMRRVLVIFLQFTRATGHRHPHLRTAFDNYSALLQAMDLPEGEPARRIVSLGPETGFGNADFRELLDSL